MAARSYCLYRFRKIRTGHGGMPGTAKTEPTGIIELSAVLGR